MEILPVHSYGRVLLRGGGLATGQLAHHLCGWSVVGESTSRTDFLTMGAQLRWKYIDGLVSLLAVGALAAYTLSLLIGHL